MVKKILSGLKLYLIQGKTSQTFLDAKWIRFLLKNTPKKFRKTVALNVLALSPHYFLGEKTENKRNFLIREYKRSLSSRQLLYKHVVANYVSPGSVVIDYGCGPGFLAKIVAAKVRKLYALDISDGVLLCANTINHRENLNYLNVLKAGANSIPDNSIDLIYTFAVLQHVSAKLVDDIFRLFYNKLKDNGKALIQVQLPDPGWKTEEEWIADNSLVGKFKYKYGLNCFSNTISFYQEKLANNKLTFLTMVEMKELLPHSFDDIYNQQLIIAEKSPNHYH
jgi:SAM-dependent methyltransferase